MSVSLRETRLQGLLVIHITIINNIMCKIDGKQSPISGSLLAFMVSANIPDLLVRAKFQYLGQ